MADPTNTMADRIVRAWLVGRPMTTREVSDTARAVVHARHGGHWQGDPDDPYVVLTVAASQRLQGLARRGAIGKVKVGGRCLWFAGLSVLEQEAARG